MTQVISVVDYIETFNRRDTRNVDYGLAYLHENSELITMLDDTEPYPKIEPSFRQACKATINNYTSGRTIPKSVQAIDCLIDQGVEFPLRYDDPVTERLIRWYTKNLLSGHLDCNFFPRFNIAPDRVDLSSELLKDLRRHSESDYVFKEGGNAIGRILYLMGLPAGHRKSTSTINLTPIRIGSQYDNLTKVVVETLISEMYDITNRPSKILRLPSNQSEFQARKISSVVETFLRKTFPNLKFTSKVYRKIKKRNGKDEILFAPELKFPHSTFEAMIA